MKLRINGNSLRLRVSPLEVARLLETGRIEETIHLSPDQGAHLTYSLEHAPQAAAMGIRYTPQQVTVVVSSDAARHWADGHDVGIYGETPTADGSLQLAIEKDFACLDKGATENSDTFPNPKAGNRVLISCGGSCSIEKEFLRRDEYAFSMVVKILSILFCSSSVGIRHS